MLNLSDKREYFRFPVYDDEVGVKLTSNKKRDFLKDIDDGFVYREQDVSSAMKKQTKNQITKVAAMTIDPVEMVEDPDYFGYEKTTAFQPKKVTVEQKSRVFKETNNTYVEPSHAKNYTAPQSTFSNKLFETDNYGKAKYNKVDKSQPKFESTYDLPGVKGKSIFKPKHIPASLIDESEEGEQSKHSRDIIVDELRKAASGNRLMLEDEVILDPITDPVDFQPTDDSEPNPEKKKNQRLEKTLSGIIADEGSPKLDSYYFD